MSRTPPGKNSDPATPVTPTSINLHPDAAAASHPAAPDDDESAEEVRQHSQTAQDRDHTIRRGDNVTTQTKEFPS